MSPRDPRLFLLLCRAIEWDESVEWLEEPDEIDLEIIPPTAGPVARFTTNASTAEQCRALACLAGALRLALSQASPEPALAMG